MSLKNIKGWASLVIVLLTAGFFIFFNVSNLHRSYADGETYIKLVYFKADLRGGAVTFSWATDAEVNNNFFTIQRSLDGIHFTDLYKQPGAGNSTSRIYYADMDENPTEGYSYYRLKDTDYDGRSGYSEIKTVKYKYNGNTDMDPAVISVTPNPFSEKFTLTFILKSATTLNLQLISTSGQVIYNEAIHTTDGMNQYVFTDQKEIPAGIYFVVLDYNGKKISQKIIKN